jgi:outer membrane immunogenic protein
MMAPIGLRAGFSGTPSMRRIIASAALSLAAIPALAADMAGPPPILRGALPAASEVDFAGFYVGGFAGWSQQSFASRDAYSTFATSNITGTPYSTFGGADLLRLPARESTSAMGFGVFAGHNWSIDGYIVGIEADYTRTKLKADSAETRSGTFVDPTAIPGFPGEAYQYAYTTNISTTARIMDYGTIRGRMGMPMGSLMPYATAGLAWARHSYSVDGALAGQRRRVDPSTTPPTPITAYAADPGAPGPFTGGTGMKMIYGYALGLGLEWALSSNILVRGEVMTMRFTDFAGGLSKSNASFSTSPNNAMSINTARVGAAVKF